MICLYIRKEYEPKILTYIPLRYKANNNFLKGSIHNTHPRSANSKGLIVMNIPSTQILVSKTLFQ